MNRPHYAWAVCLGGCLSLFTVIGLGINIYSVYQPYIIEFNHFTNAQGSFITTVRSLFSLGAMLTVNQLCNRFGLRQVMTLGMALMTLSCLCFGLAEQFAVYCAAAALSGLAYCYAGMVPLSLVIGHWFRDRRGFALGVASAGSGMSTVVASPAITSLINSHGLRTAFLAEGAVILLLTGAVWALVRSSPEEMGTAPYQTAGSERTRPAVERTSSGGGTAAVWVLLFAGFLIGAPAGPGFSHLTVLYTSSGYDSMKVAGFLSVFGLMICVGKIVCGQIYDAIGGWLGNFYIFGVLLAAFGLSFLAPLGGDVLPYIAMTLFGLGLPISAVPFAIWAQDVGGDEGYEGTVRSLTVAYALGMLVFGPLPGILADRAGSYVPAYMVFALLTAAAMVIVQSIYRKLGIGRRP